MNVSVVKHLTPISITGNEPPSSSNGVTEYLTNGSASISPLNTSFTVTNVPFSNWNEPQLPKLQINLGLYCWIAIAVLYPAFILPTPV